MPCFRPLKAFSLTSGGISFSERGDVRGDIKLPCGQCIGCRIDRARDWTLRIGHESKLHSRSWFATLTYDQEHLPNPPSLNYLDFQLFMKRARKAYGAFRFFMCGEYGEQGRRPHYHAILFGLELPDAARFGGSDQMPTYRSAKLEKLWGKGMTVLGSVTPQSANYVARYNLKKVNGDRAELHYRYVDPDGEVHQLEPEFCKMSTRPGIGASWYDKFHSDVHTHDYVIRDGQKNPVPRYYDKLAKRAGTYELDEIKQQRQLDALPKAWNNTPDRLAVRETVLKSRTSLSKRPL